MLPAHPSGEPIRIAVIGLGYVGLPLCVAFSGLADTLGFDIDERRVAELQRGVDRTLEVGRSELHTGRAPFSSDTAALRDRNVFIITVPTSIDTQKRPDLGALCAATRTVATVLKRGDVVVYESTVFPGPPRSIAFRGLSQALG
jgi:UDP-N-acetyl-D-galactosamine dehydrogenase